jgi:hypothetical protein
MCRGVRLAAPRPSLVSSTHVTCVGPTTTSSTSAPHSTCCARRAEGKQPKVALIAAMRKLLHIVYSVTKNRRPFVPVLFATLPSKIAR